MRGLLVFGGTKNEAAFFSHLFNFTEDSFEAFSRAGAVKQVVCDAGGDKVDVNARDVEVLAVELDPTY